MTLQEHINSISNIAMQIRQQDDELHKKHGLELGISIGDPASQAYLSEARNLKDPLAIYLAGVGLSDLAKLVTVMYAGRDYNQLQEAGSLAEFHESLKAVGVHNGGREKYERIILEKVMNLPIYYKQFNDMAQIMGIDPESDWVGG
ncbi:hypothetical protein [Billgrantia desiderata]|uniref:hypothetical protein n=1 Tax=Billgrantia desiderata TaxID=52021 RepID=UPI003F3444B2